MIRRLASLCLAALLLFSLSPSALAAETGGAAVYISTAEQFITFAENCARESYSLNRRFVLRNDIDLTGLVYRPAGYFAGRFDGGGHTVRGLNLEGDGSRLGLFRQIVPGAAVENLNVEGRVQPGGSREYVGGIVGVNEGTVENCRFTGDVRAIRAVGGIAGSTSPSGTVRSCVFTGFLIGEHQVGGIAGENEGVLAACVSEGEVNSVAVTPSGERSFDLAALSQDDFVNLSDIGGVVGENSGVVDACVNRAVVGYPYTGYNVGGVAGKSSGFLYACRNEGAVEGRRDVGGIVGQLIPSAAWNLSNGRLEELSQAVSYMHYLIDNIHQNTEDYSNAFSKQVENLNYYTIQTVYALENVMKQLAESDTSIFDNIGIDPTTGRLIIPNEGFPNVDLSDLNRSLFSMYEQVGVIGDLAKSTFEAVGDDLRDISNQMGYILNLLLSAIQEDGSDLLVTRDLSFTEAYEHSEGAVANCVSRGEVHGETNVGGVAGSSGFELSFDMEDTLNSSSLLPTHAEQILFAVVRACEFSGTVRSRSDNAGGIIGRAEIGAVVDCVGKGRIVSQSGNMVGGIAGSSRGMIARCWARSSLEGGRSLGGIVGEGTDLQNCRAWVHIARGTEYLGAVAGWAGGEIGGNLYVDGRPDGVDGISRIGQAEPIGMAAFLALDGAPQSFDTVTVRFRVEGETVSTLKLPFGGAVGSLPPVPKRDGAYWVWDEFEQGAVYSDLEIGGKYFRPGSTLSSGEAVPQFLVEGEFYENQSLHVMPYTPDWEGDNLLGGYTLAVNDYGGTLTVRMRSEENVGIYRMNAAGGWNELPASRDGRYVVFELPNGGSFAVVQAEKLHSNRHALFLGAAALLLVLILTVLVVRRRRRAAKRAEKRRRAEREEKPRGGEHLKE